VVYLINAKLADPNEWHDVAGKVVISKISDIISNPTDASE